MIIVRSGRQIEVPQDGQGRADIQEVRRIAGITSDRALIVQKPSGENELLPSAGQVRLDPYARLLDAPRAKRGCM